MDIVLIGYRASGKSSVGRRLAERLQRVLIDTDDLVRQRFDGAPISDIFSEHGEEGFRRVEVEEALGVLEGHDFVASFGGGTPVQPAVAEALEGWQGFCVYLSAPAEVLAERITQDVGPGADRPSLSGQQSAAEEVSSILAERDPVYRRLADLEIDVSQSDVAEVTEQILSEIR